MQHDPILSLVVPVFNEEEAIAPFLARVRPVLERVCGADYEIVFVNDGSRDATLQMLEAESSDDPRLKLVDLSRNFGKELALTAGIDHTAGQAVIPIDVDLQDPPEVIEEMVERWRQGHDVVLAARSDRSDDTRFKRVTARMFYRLMMKISDIDIPADVGDYRLMDRRVVEALKLMPERARFMKGMFAWVGFRQTTVYFKREGRTAGQTKQRFRSLVRLAVDGIVSFTSLPLRIWSLVGLGVAVAAVLYMLFVVIQTLAFGSDVPGYASLIVVMLFFSGLNMLSVGVLGEYIARIFIEVKQRPAYLVRETRNLGPAAGGAPNSSNPAD